jgi:16S rRNA (guanine966-N2)-methyltransferase
MRVAGGSARGMPLRSPSRPGVRPTMDRVKTALFNILAQEDVQGAVALDLYSGTGSLGIEALSRGAAYVDFVESDARQCADIRTSLEVTKLEMGAKVWHLSVERALPQLERRYDLVLMDPPYRDPFPAQVLERLADMRLLQSHAVVVAGHATRTPAPPRCGALAQWADRRYGDSSLAFYSFEPAGEPAYEPVKAAAP